MSLGIRSQTSREQDILLAHPDARRDVDMLPQRSAHQLEMALRAGRMGTWTWDPATGLVECDQHHREMWDLDRTATLVPVESIYARILPEDMPSVRQREAEGFAAGHIETQFRIRRSDGQVRWIACYADILRDSYGQATSVVGINYDITDRVREISERKRYEQALEESRRRLSVALDAAEMGTWVYTFADNICIYSEPAQRLYGLPDPRLLHDEQGVHHVIHEDDIPRMWQAVRKACDPDGDGRYHVEYRVRRAEGGWRWLSVWGRTEFEGVDGRRTPVRMVGASRDITDQKLAEERLAAELEMARRLHDLSTQLIEADDIESLYGRILDTAVAVMHADFGSLQLAEDGPDGRPVLRLLRYHGFTPQAADFWQVVRPDSRSTCGIALKERQRVFVEDVPGSSIMAGSEDQATYLATGIRAVQTTPLIARSGRLLGMISTHWRVPHVASPEELRYLDLVARQAADLLDRRLAEEALRESERTLKQAKIAAEEANRAKDHFLAVLSHELRTPLTPVLMALSEHLNDPGLSAKLRADLAVVHRNINLETRLIDDLLDITRIARGKLVLQPGPVDLRDVVNHAANTCLAEARGRGLELVVDLGQEPIVVVGDATRLQQVFWNLIKNAVKFTAKGQVRVRAAVEEKTATVVVEDDGIGMEPAVVARIFRAFEQGDAGTTRRFGGLGLGLAISKAIVELHDGAIVAHSDGHEKGSCFTVTLPRAAGQVTPRGTAAPAHGGLDARKAQILLVEDHDDSARLLVRMLRRCGHEVKHAGDVATALRMANAERFDVLVSDIGLPDGTGLDLMRQVRLIRPDLPGIALSGHGMESDMRMSREAGFRMHLVKPVDPKHLERVVAEVVGR